MEKQEQSHQIDMLNGPLAGKLLMFALPMMLTSILNLLFNAADVIVVGRYVGSSALAAVGSNISLISLLLNLFMGLSVGANVVVARDLGAGDRENVRKGVHTSITLALISGLVLMTAGAALAKVLLVITSSPADIIDLAALYLRIYMLGVPASMLQNFGAGILRTQGDTKRPLYFLTAAGALNVALNLLFVLPMRMGVAGVALATAISQYFAAVCVLLCLVRERGPLHLDLRRLGVDRGVLARILQIGLPAGFQSVLFSLSNVVIQSSINSFNSAAVVAGSAAALNLESFVYSPTSVFCGAAVTFVSQNYGAGKCGRVDRTLALCLCYSTIVGLLLGGAAVVFARPLLSIYVPGEEEVIKMAVIRVKWVCPFYCVCALMDTMAGALRGLGYSMTPMLCSILGACGFRILWVATVFRAHRSLDVLYAVYPVSWLITALAHCVFFLLIRKRTYAKAGTHAGDMISE